MRFNDDQLTAMIEAAVVQDKNNESIVFASGDLKGPYRDLWADGIFRLTVVQNGYKLSPRGRRIIKRWQNQGLTSGEMLLKALDGDKTIRDMLKAASLEYVDLHPRPEQICSYKLYKALGFGGSTIPLEFAKDYGLFPCPDSRGNIVGNFHVKVLPSNTKTKKRFKHRVVIECKCGRDVPFSRFAYHNCPAHYEWADKFPWKAVRRTGTVSYHKSREKALQEAGGYGKVYRWDLSADAWTEDKDDGR